MPTLYILVGVPGSGKTTYAKQRFPGIVRIGSDDLRKKLFGTALTLRGHRQVHRILQRLAAARLRSGKDVVIDCMNVTRTSRRVYFQLCPKGCRVEAIYLETPLLQMIRNNRARTRQIPVIGIVWNRLRLRRPSYREGFDRIRVESWKKRCIERMEMRKNESRR